MHEKGTEAPFSGKLLHNNKSGVYTCVACGSQLFTSENKFDSNQPGLMGWPSFSELVDDKKIELKDDDSGGMRRIEVVCKTCGGHLGHLFDDKESPSRKHYCINSCVLDFVPKK